MLGSGSPAQTVAQPQPQAHRPQTKKPQTRKGKPIKSFRHQTEVQVWVEGKTDDGHTYYYNTITGGKGDLKTQQYSIKTHHIPNIFPYFLVRFTLANGVLCCVCLVTTDSQWEKPEGFQGESTDSAQSEHSEVIHFSGCHELN